jgi:hypothetical protein
MSCKHNIHVNMIQKTVNKLCTENEKHNIQRRRVREYDTEDAPMGIR